MKRRWPSRIGADEIDIVINVGKMLEGHYDEVANEVEVLRGEAGEDVVLKVIRKRVR